MCAKIGQVVEDLKDENSNVYKRDQNSSVLKKKIIIPTFMKIGTQYQCLERDNKIRNPVFIEIGPEYQCLER